MAIDAVAPVLQFLVSPVDPSASYRAGWCLKETISALFRSGSDGGQAEGAGAFATAQYSGQSAFSSISGPLAIIRFLRDGTIEYGVDAAVASQPSSELCGVYANLFAQTLQSKIERDETLQISFDPPLPAGEVLLWESEQGERWENVVPARAPQVSAIRHAGAPINRTVKVRTVTPWQENGGFSATFDLGGIPPTHIGDAAFRLSWGDQYSLVARGHGASARVQLEERVEGAWKLLRAFDHNAPVDDKFWQSIHTLGVQRLGGRLVVQWDGAGYWVQQISLAGGQTSPRAVSWPKAPLRLAVVGAAVNLQISRLTGVNSDGTPVAAKWSRNVPAPNRPTDNSTIPFDIRRSNAQNLGAIKACLVGSQLSGVRIQGNWSDLAANYTATMTCTATESPLLCSFAIYFPPPAGGAPPAPIDLFQAVSSWSVDSGDPEILPDGQAQFTVSRSQLDKLIPDWETAVLPYRPITIRAKYPDVEEWTMLFSGYLTPQSVARDGWDSTEIPLEARGQLLKLMEPYGLIDERFAPLDLLITADKGALYGAEAVKGLIAMERGEAAVTHFNGDENGDALLYFTAPYPLLDTVGPGYFAATDSQRQKGDFQLPPPFGQYLKDWIDAIAKFDYAAWFNDSSDGQFYYGRIVEFLIARGETVWEVDETAPPSSAHTSQHWPLLSSLSATGLLDGAYNDVRVWSAPAPGWEQLSPGLLVGRAGDGDADSLDPLSVAQSGRRTIVVKNDMFKAGVVDGDYIQALAYSIWQGFKGRPPKRVDLTFETGFLGPRWGQIIRLLHGFDGERNGGASEDLRILQVKHSGSMNGEGNRFETVITAAALDGFGQ